MGVLIPSKENELIDIIRQDISEKMDDIIIKNNFNKNSLIGPYKRTLIQVCAYYGSVECLKDLINMNFDINELESSSNNSPLYIACKFNYIDIVHILLNNRKQKCKILRKNNEGLNEFEVAFLRGNYQICYYLLYIYLNFDEYKNKIIYETMTNIKSNENHIEAINKENEYLKFFNNINFCLEKYLGIQEYLLYPVFNMPLFYKSLKEKLSPEECPSFEAERKKTKEILTKIPDPNESWGNFLKRITNFELYNPPLVDKNKVSKANSLYMKTQMKIISREYRLPMDYYNNEDLNNINKDEEKHLLNNNNNIEKLYEEETKREKSNDNEDKNSNNNNF